jgi:hypothetical protein
MIIDEREYYKIIKQISEVKDLLGEVLRRLGKLEYTGELEFGDLHIPEGVHGLPPNWSKKAVNVSLKRKEEEDG